MNTGPGLLVEVNQAIHSMEQSVKKPLSFSLCRMRPAECLAYQEICHLDGSL